MAKDARFWYRLHFELGQLPEYTEFRQLLAGMASHPETERRVSNREKQSKVAYRKLARGPGTGVALYD
jgi:hypothetical protein